MRKHMCTLSQWKQPEKNHMLQHVYSIAKHPDWKYILEMTEIANTAKKQGAQQDITGIFLKTERAKTGK